MRVRAKHWVSYGGVMHPAGAEFEISTTDEKVMRPYVDIVETPIDEPVKKTGGRKKKTEE